MSTVKIKYLGKGILSKGIFFTQEHNDGLYEVDKETADYLVSTFGEDNFVIIENVKKPAPKKQRAKKKEEPVDEEG